MILVLKIILYLCNLSYFRTVWKNASSSLKKILKNRIILKEDSKSQKKYSEQVVEKLEEFNSEDQNLSEPITEYKAVNIKDLEESAKERANPDDLKKIIFKLASSENKKEYSNRFVRK